MTLRLRSPSAAAPLLVLLATTTLPASPQEPTHIEGLGSLSFPNSGAPEAQHDFLRGLLLLHSFEYGYAAEAFRKAQEIDPDFAMAYWGEAMTYTHPVWNEKDKDAAVDALARYAPTPAARAAKAPTERERAYLAAVDVLYGRGDKAALDTLYSMEMEKVASAYPDDLDAQLFYALSLLGLSQGDRDVPTYMEAGAIALAAFQQNPQHPGAAHYTIHSFDDPTHAVLAMKAARAYGAIAPEAAHAQHMTTHIFLARGLWDDVVEANIRADAVVDRNLAARGAPPTFCGHYNQWLMYGYQEQGRYDDAETLLMGCYAQAHDERLTDGNRRSAAGSYVYMRSLNLADTRHWDGRPARSALDVTGSPIVPQLMQAWGSGVTAVHRGDRATAERHYAFLRDEGGSAETAWQSPYVPVWQGTLNAMLLADAGDGEGALRAAKAAAEYEAALPVDFGPPIAFKPARELEGEILLELGRAEDALTAFQTALARTPNRILSLAGYARAAVVADRMDIATNAYRRLADLLTQADADMPEAREARAFLANRGTQSGR
jgi:tetratricopeptide (TPR) repeat protein